MLKLINKLEIAHPFDYEYILKVIILAIKYIVRATI
jgi:hypothetical protein